MLKFILAITLGLSLGLSLSTLSGCGKNTPAKYPDLKEDGSYVRRNDALYFHLMERRIFVRVPPDQDSDWKGGPIPDQSKARDLTYYMLYKEASKPERNVRRSNMYYSVDRLKEYIENTNQILRIAEANKIPETELSRELHTVWRENAKQILALIDGEKAAQKAEEDAFKPRQTPKPSPTNPTPKPSASPSPTPSASPSPTPAPERVPLPRPRPKPKPK